MAAPAGADRHRRPRGDRRHRLPRPAASSAGRLGRGPGHPLGRPRCPSPGNARHQHAPTSDRGVAGPGPAGPAGPVGRARRDHRRRLGLERQRPAAGGGNPAGLVPAGSRPFRHDRRAARRQRRVPVHPGGRRLGGAGRPRRQGRLRQLRRPADAGVVPGRRRSVGGPGRPGEPGRAGRRGRRSVADDLPGPRRGRPRPRDGAGDRALRRRAGAGHRACRPGTGSRREPIGACCSRRPARSPGRWRTGSGTRPPARPPRRQPAPRRLPAGRSTT